MEEILNQKEVYFHNWCNRCQHEKLHENDLPCNDCLAAPFNYGSSKPIYFRKKEER